MTSRSHETISCHGELFVASVETTPGCGEKSSVVGKAIPIHAKDAPVIAEMDFRVRRDDSQLWRGEFRHRQDDSHPRRGRCRESRDDFRARRRDFQSRRAGIGITARLK